MKYKSELIKEIVESRGHETSSIHYESECFESWIEEAMGSYPKLCDYQSEWLNYINENPLGKFPYETVSNVTDATINNVVPYAYNKAILTGRTLVNIKENQVSIGQEGRQVEYEIPLVKMNTKYFIKYKLTSTSSWVAIGFLNDLLSWSNNSENQPLEGQFILNSGTNPCYFRIGGLAETTTTVDYLMIIEYQEGMENWNIPYFEGMQSVKMPVLTTSNEDGTKTNILTVNEDVELRGIENVKDELDCLTGEVVERIGEIVLDGTQSNVGYSSQYSNDDYYCFMYDITKNGYKKAPSSPIGISCPIPFQQNKMFPWATAKEFVLIDGNDLVVKLLKSRLSNDNSISTLNSYLASNPITINYPLMDESIKTVELTVIDQDGITLSRIKPIEGTMHLSTSGTPIKPSFNGEIPVEATSQNLASFIGE